MLKALFNEAYLRLDITTRSPLLIKSGYATVIGADMAPVLTYRNKHQEVYIPGSSLKGVFRSHIEKVVNTIKPQVACDPFLQYGFTNDPGVATRREDAGQTHRSSCGRRIQGLPSHKAYAGSCPTCRLFGSTSFIGRIAIDDAYLPEESDGRESLIEHRDGIAIDRLTGGASGSAKFDLEVVTVGTKFSTTIRLRNFEIWQLGMLLVIVQDMDDELIRIGSGRSRGLGKIKATISEQKDGSYDGGIMMSTICESKEKEPDKELWGLGRWLADETTYDTKRDDLLTLAQPITHTTRGVRNVRTFKGDALENIKNESISYFVKRMQNWSNVSEEATTRAPYRR